VLLLLRLIFVLWTFQGVEKIKTIHNQAIIFQPTEEVTMKITPSQWSAMHKPLPNGKMLQVQLAPLLWLSGMRAF
jgi:hypothetical protein